MSFGQQYWMIYCYMFFVCVYLKEQMCISGWEYKQKEVKICFVFVSSLPFVCVMLDFNTTT